MEETKRNRTVILLVTIAVVMAIIFEFADQADNVYTSEKWLQNPSGRWDMADDIVRTDALINGTLAEIIDKLGEPTGLGKPDSSFSAYTTINYFLGVDELSGMRKYLCLDLKQDNVVLIYTFFDK